MNIISNNSLFNIKGEKEITPTNITNSNNNNNNKYKKNQKIKSLFQYLRNNFDNNSYEDIELLNDNIYKTPTNNCNNGIGFLENSKNILNTIKENKLNLDTLYKIISYSTSSSFKYQFINQKCFNFIPYDEAIELFKLFDQESDCPVSRVFIVSQFFVYYSNKKDKNQREYCNFICKVILDKSTLVNECFKYIIKEHYNQKDQDNNNSGILIYYILEIIFNSKERLKELKSLPTSTILFKRNLELLLESYNNNINNGIQNFIDNHQPTFESQRFFLELFYEILIKKSFNKDNTVISNMKKLQSYKLSSEESLNNNSNNNCEDVIGEFLESRKKLKTTITITTQQNNNDNNNNNSNNNTSNNNSNKYNIEVNSEIMQKIIGYTLKTDDFLRKMLIQSQQLIKHQKKKDGLVEIEEKWKEILDSTKRVILSLASVSKRFHYNLGRVLENIDWSTFKADKLLSDQVSFGKPLSLIQKPPAFIRYDTLIRITPYDFIGHVFSQVEYLMIIGDLVKVSSIKEENENSNTFNMCHISYNTFPPLNSFPFLTKLTIVGRAFGSVDSLNNCSETGGLFLIKYILANTGCQLEEFTLVNQQSLLFSDFFDTSIIQCLLENHSSTLKTIRLKYSCITKQVYKLITKILNLIEPYKESIKVEYYQGIKTRSKDPLFSKRLVFKKVDQFIQDNENLILEKEICNNSNSNINNNCKLNDNNSNNNYSCKLNDNSCKSNISSTGSKLNSKSSKVNKSVSINKKVLSDLNLKDNKTVAVNNIAKSIDNILNNIAKNKLKVEDKVSNKIKSTDKIKLENQPLKNKNNNNSNSNSNNNYNIKLSKSEESIIIPIFDKLTFSLSGFDAEDNSGEFELLKQQILKLGGKFESIISKNITHLIIKNPVRSEKVMGAAASGSWILKPSFIVNSYNFGRVENEENHLWIQDQDNVKEIDCYIKSAMKCRRLINMNGGRRLFENSRVAYYNIPNSKCIQDSSVWRRILSCGKAEIIEFHEITNIQTLKSLNVTHFLIFENNTENDPIQSLIENKSSGIQIIYPITINNLILDAQYLIPLPQQQQIDDNSNNKFDIIESLIKNYEPEVKKESDRNRIDMIIEYPTTTIVNEKLPQQEYQHQDQEKNQDQNQNLNQNQQQQQMQQQYLFKEQPNIPINHESIPLGQIESIEFSKTTIDDELSTTIVPESPQHEEDSPSEVDSLNEEKPSPFYSDLDNYYPSTIKPKAKYSPSNYNHYRPPPPPNYYHHHYRSTPPPPPPSYIYHHYRKPPPPPPAYIYQQYNHKSHSKNNYHNPYHYQHKYHYNNSSIDNIEKLNSSSLTFVPETPSQTQSTQEQLDLELESSIHEPINKSIQQTQNEFNVTPQKQLLQLSTLVSPFNSSKKQIISYRSNINLEDDDESDEFDEDDILSSPKF